MQPPPFNSAPKKKNNTVMIVMVVGALGLCCVGPVILLGVGGYFGAKVMKSTADCAVSMAMVQEAVNKYAADNKGTLPKAATWQDDIKPYYAKLIADPENSTGPITAFKTDEVWVCVDTEGGKTGVAFNKDLSKKKLADIKDKSTVVIFETERTGTNLTESYKPKAKDNAPKIFGSHRDWITIPVEGELKMGKGAKFQVK